SLGGNERPLTWPERVGLLLTAVLPAQGFRPDGISESGTRHTSWRNTVMKDGKYASVVLAVAALAATPLLSHAQAWVPNRMIEYTVPSGPGTALDTAARKLKEILEKKKLVTQLVVVTNKSGASGAIAINTLLQHPGNPH